MSVSEALVAEGKIDTSRLRRFEVWETKGGGPWVRVSVVYHEVVERKRRKLRTSSMLAPHEMPAGSWGRYVEREG